MQFDVIACWGANLSEQVDGPDQSAFVAALDHILASGSLGNSSRLITLLRYVVTEELEGRGDRIKSYTIATDVFGRSADFDANTDSIVRVEFRRLRQALEHYYATKGTQAAVRIVLPSGTYRPAFRVDSQASVPDPGDHPAIEGPAQAMPFLAPSSRKHGGLRNIWFAAAALVAAALGGAGLFHAYQSSVSVEQISKQSDIRRIVLVVLPASYDNADRPLAAYANGLRERILAALSKQRTYLTSGSLKSINEEETGNYLIYSLSINVQQGNSRMLVTASLNDERGIQVWGDTLSKQLGYGFALQDETINWLVRDLRPHVLGAAKREIASAKGMFVERDVWSLYVSAAFSANEFASSLKAEQERIALSRKAVELNPQFGQAHALLAHMQAHLINTDPPSDTALLRREAEKHALTVLQTAAQDSDALYNLGSYNWSIGQMKEAELMAKRALELDPYNVAAQVLAEAARYTCNKPPRGPIARLRKLDASLSPDNPARWLVLLALSQLFINADNSMAALEYARKANVMHRGIESVYLFAALLNRRGQPAEARTVLARLGKEWPNADLNHYSEVVIPRRCPNGTRAAELQKLFKELSDAQLVTSSVDQ